MSEKFMEYACRATRRLSRTKHRAAIECRKAPLLSCVDKTISDGIPTGSEL